jgi:hypothetical protein
VLVDRTIVNGQAVEKVGGQIARSQPGEPTSRAISAETIKIPEPKPIIDPATSMVASRKPSPLIRPPSDAVSLVVSLVT